MRTADFQAYSTAAGGAPRRGALLPKVVVFTTLGAALFYGGSVAAAQRSPEYKQFFVERVYGGKKLLESVNVIIVDPHSTTGAAKSVFSAKASAAIVA